MNKHSSQYKRHRFPPEIIQHVVWLYHRFNLSTRDIEDLMAERGIAVSYESIRLWCINSALSTPGDFGVGIKVLVILSISTKSLSEFKASNTINRAELSHQPTRVRERGMRRFKSLHQAQRFLSTHAAVYNLFNLGRHMVSAKQHRYFRQRAFASWNDAVAL